MSQSVTGNGQASPPPFTSYHVFMAVGKDPGSPGGRSVLEGAFTLLDVLNEVHSAGLSRLAALSGLPKATAYRLLQQLIELDVIVKEGLTYRVGPRVFALGQTWRPDPVLLSAGRGPMQRLVRASGASLGLCVRAHDQIVVAGSAIAAGRELVPMHQGMVWPRSTAASKMLLAWDQLGEVRRSPLGSAEAEDLRLGGIALDHETTVPGVFCAAVPVFGPSNSALVAVLCAVMTEPQRLPQMTDALQRASIVITRSLS